LVVAAVLAAAGCTVVAADASGTATPTASRHSNSRVIRDISV
jgi:hypothetical protein